MIQINLLPGARKPVRSASKGFNVGALFSGAATQIRDPFLIVALVGLVIGAGATAYQHLTLSSAGTELEERRERAVADSGRYALVIAERERAADQLASVVGRFSIIHAIDGERYTWSHVLTELSEALPPSTWLTRIEQTSEPISVVRSDSASNPRSRRVEEIAAAAMASVPRLQLRVIGQTVDIQALTRYMRLLEASPFLENVNFVRSDARPIAGVNLVDFTIEMQYQKPDSSVIRTVPLTVGVR
jgi:Tfp pilus assembly protein PilN